VEPLYLKVAYDAHTSLPLRAEDCVTRNPKHWSLYGSHGHGDHTSVITQADHHMLICGFQGRALIFKSISLFPHPLPATPPCDLR